MMKNAQKYIFQEVYFVGIFFGKKTGEKKTKILGICPSNSTKIKKTRKEKLRERLSCQKIRYFLFHEKKRFLFCQKTFTVKNKKI